MKLKIAKIKKSWIVWAVLILAAVAGIIILLQDRVDMEAWKNRVDEMPGFGVFALMAVLPIFGFPVGVVYVFAGIRFGPWLGLGVVAASIAIHLIVTYWLSHSFLQDRIHRFFAKKKWKLPEVPKEEYVAVTVLAALIPGLPYAIRNYLLALTSVPFRLYFLICWPIYLLRSWMAIFLGELSLDWEWDKLLWIGGILVVKLTICAFLIKRVRDHLKRGKAQAA